MWEDAYYFFGTLTICLMLLASALLIQDMYKTIRMKRSSPSEMTILYYNDDPPTRKVKGVFLAGPTSNEEHTAWRVHVTELLRQKGYKGYVMIPEFRDGGFEKNRLSMADGRPSSIEGSDRASERITDWETVGLENCSQVLFWMPFSLGEKGDPNSLPGFATRGEVQRLMLLRPKNTILGMPEKAFRGGLVRYWASKYGLKIHKTLEDSVNQVK
jgi:hypothetical protein